jgi:hypothetical protein
MFLRDKLLPSPDPVASPPQEPWRKALRDAAEYIRVHGHCNTGPHGPNGEVCVAVAMSQVGTAFPDFVAAIRHLAPLVGSPDPDCIVAWNDAPERTAEEVIAALEAAASAP